MRGRPAPLTLLLLLTTAACVEEGLLLTPQPVPIPPVEPIEPVEPGGVCGDGARNQGEQCDDGLNDGSYGGCNPDCSLGPRCGDGRITHEEVCDDGVNDGRRCSTDCLAAITCGDGIVDQREECDDGPDNSNTRPGACRRNCRLAACQDGVVDPDEVCLGRTIEIDYPHGASFKFVRSTADRNLDGVDDALLVEGRDGTSTITVALGRRGELTLAWQTVEPGWVSEALDIDGVPPEDLVVVSRGTGTVFLGTESGGLRRAGTIESVDHEVVEVSDARDFNHDGNLDLVISAQPTAEVEADVLVLLGDGTGRFSRSTMMRRTQRGIFALDFDGDGNDDLVSDPEDALGSGEVRVALGDGRGGFSPWTVMFSIEELSTVRPANLDGQPPIDFMGLIGTEARTQPFVNQGGALVEAGPSYVRGAPAFVPWADVDNDGVDEVLIYRGGLQIHDLPGGELVARVPYEYSSARIGIWDMGDGSTRAVVVGPFVAHTHWILPNGQLADAATFTLDSSANDHQPLELDRDALQDFVLRGVGSFGAAAYVPGSLAEYSKTVNSSGGTFVEAVDVNGDGHLDVVTAGGYHLGDGRGGLQPLRRLSVLGVGDLGAQGIALFRNNQNGIGIMRWVDGNLQQVNQLQTIENVFQVGAGDITGDGAPDFVILRTDGMLGRVLVEVLASSGVNPPNISLPSDGDHRFLIAEASGDNREDLLIYDRRDQFAELHVSTEGGFVSTATLAFSAGVAFADMDLDGRADIVADNRIRFAHGGETTLDAEVEFPPGVGHFDGDGLPDVVFGGHVISGAARPDAPIVRKFVRAGAQQIAADLNEDGIDDLIALGLGDIRLMLSYP